MAREKPLDLAHDKRGRRKDCPQCNGTGLNPHVLTKDDTCIACNGTGKVCAHPISKGG